LKRRLLILGSVAAAVLMLDIITKAWAARALQFAPPRPLLGEFVRLTYVRNSGVAFGLGAGLPFPYYLFSIAAIVAILWIVFRRPEPGRARLVALSLILGGAVGNLIDRLRAGEVVDFIDLGVGRWRWPVFNLADSAVTVGVLLFALAWPRHGGHGAQPAQAAPLSHEPAARDLGAAGRGGSETRPLPGGRGD
jgi:signal peptidase II